MPAVENKMRPIHPGEILREEFLLPMGITPHALSVAIGVPAPRIHDITRERRAITADTALRLAAFFGVAVEFWMGLQADYDTAKARALMADTLSGIRRFCPAQASALPR
jgi:addiction module HigA family antidote